MKQLYLLLTLFIYTNSFCFNKQVKVKNVIEFFEALDNNTEIIVQCETLNFTLGNLEKKLNLIDFEEHWSSENNLLKRNLKSYYLSGGLILHGYENLIIRSEEHTNMISEDNFGNILSFKNCKKIVLEGFSIFHTPVIGKGVMLSILSTSNVTINNCYLNNSTIGVTLIGANNVKFNNVEIFNNIYYPIYSINSDKITFKDCDISNNSSEYDSESVIYSDISDLTFNNCSITNNQSNKLIYSFLNIIPFVNFKNCTIEENVFNFNFQKFINNSYHEKSKKDKQKMKIKLFLIYLENELGSDYDNRNNEFLSLFSYNYKIIYKNQTNFTDFISFYYSLKKKQIQIYDFKIIDSKVLVNQKTEKPEIWSFYFDRKNKIKKIEVK